MVEHEDLHRPLLRLQLDPELLLQSFFERRARGIRLEVRARRQGATELRRVFKREIESSGEAGLVDLKAVELRCRTQRVGQERDGHVSSAQAYAARDAGIACRGCHCTAPGNRRPRFVSARASGRKQGLTAAGGTWCVGGVRLELRAGLSGLGENVCEYREVVCLVMDGKFETIGQQGAHHQAHFVLAWTSLGARLDVEAFGGRPSRELRHQVLTLIAEHLVGQKNGVGKCQRACLQVAQCYRLSGATAVKLSVFSTQFRSYWPEDKPAGGGFQTRAWRVGARLSLEIRK